MDDRLNLSPCWRVLLLQQMFRQTGWTEHRYVGKQDVM